MNSYPYRQNNTPEEIELRHEINRRIGAVKLAETFLARHLRYGDTKANVAFLTDAVMALGLANSEITTERLTEILAVVEHKMADSEQFTDCFRILRGIFPFMELTNEATIKAILREYRGENPYDDELFPDRLVRLIQLPKMKPFLAPNEKWAKHQQNIATVSADGAARGNAIVGLTAYLFDKQTGEPYGKTAYDKRITQMRIDAETAALSALPPDQLAANWAAFKESERMKGLTRDQLRAEIRTKEAVRLTALRNRFEPLPDLYVPIGRIEGVPWTTKLLKSLPSTEISRLLKLFGDQQLDSACAESASKGRY